MVSKITQQHIQLITHRSARAGAKGAQSIISLLPTKGQNPPFLKGTFRLEEKEEILYRKCFEHMSSWALTQRLLFRRFKASRCLCEEAEEAEEQGLTKAYQTNIQLCSPFSVF